MKKFVFVVPLFLLSFLFFTFDYSNHLNEETSQTKRKLQSEFPSENKNIASDYSIEVTIFPDQKVLKASQRIVWKNLTDKPTSELQLHLYPNALANNKTEFAKRFELSEDEQTKIEFEEVLLNEKAIELEYFQPEIENEFDSTVAKISLSKPINPSDSVILYFQYQLEIPRSVSRFGYASGREFYFIAQWFPKLGVYENGEWICSQYHTYTEFYSDFSNYEVTIISPKDFLIGATGQLTREEVSGSNKTSYFRANNVIDFAWTASPKFKRKSRSYLSISGEEIEVEFLIQPENNELLERKFNSAFNTLSFLEDKIGEYPYHKITLVDVPRTSNIGGMEYPQIVTYFTPLYTPIEIQDPESTIIHEIVHQYFYAAVSSNEVYSAWLDEGITTYLEEKILDYYYGKPELYFRFIDYYPIFGIKFLSLGEIPLVYTLRELPYEHYASSLAAYYMNGNLGSLCDSSYQLPTGLSYAVNAYSKPNLLLHTLEGYIGEEAMLNILSEYYEKNSFSLVTADDFIDVLKQEIDTEYSWFVDQFVYENNKFDYRLTSIEQTDKNKYSIFVERLEEGISPIEIFLYTETDTLQLNWNGQDRWKEFEITSEEKIISGEIDPRRKNKFDLNFANNSYIIESKYWGSLSIAIRWFFWVQNAMLIFGSAG